MAMQEVPELTSTHGHTASTAIYRTIASLKDKKEKEKKKNLRAGRVTTTHWESILNQVEEAKK